MNFNVAIAIFFSLLHSKNSPLPITLQCLTQLNIRTSGYCLGTYSSVTCSIIFPVITVVSLLIPSYFLLPLFIGLITLVNRI